MNVKHPNSRIVTLYRKDTFIVDAQKGSAADFIAMSKKSLGSYWENSYSRTQGSGLNFEEQMILMPTLVDCTPEDRNFRQKVSEYFASMKTLIPYEKGRSLEIGLTKSNSEPLSVTNQPLNLADYVTYRHALAHPLVAKSQEEARDNILKEYYIFDPEAAEDAQVKDSGDKDRSLELYLTIKKTPAKVDMLLTLLGVDPRTFKGKNASSLKLERLKEIANSTPDVFISTFENKHFEELYVIQSMVNTGVLTRTGERYLDLSTGTTIGHSTAETVAWLKDKANSEAVAILKARMQEGLSKPAPATSKIK